MLGENQFKGVQIYDVIQDDNLNYLISTNDGIYFYNQINYERLECEEAKSNSVFNFVKNKKGDIYCHNLNNQILKIKEKKCSVFYDLRSNDWSPDISLSISEENYLVIGAKNIIVLDGTAKIITTYKTPTHYISIGYTSLNKEIQFHLSGTDSLVTYSKGVFKILKLQVENAINTPLNYLKIFKINKQPYAIDLDTKFLYSYDDSKHVLKIAPKNSAFERTRSTRIYETSDNIWVTGTLPGVTPLNNNTIKSNLQIYFADYFISDVYQDNEGNILLSTFDKGILVIPDLNIPDVIASFQNDPITCLYSDSTMGLMLGSSKGKLMNYKNGKLNTIRETGKRPIEVIYGDAKSELIFFDDGLIRALDKLTNKIYDISDASLKSASIASKEEFYIGTNRGILKGLNKGKGKISTEWLLQPECRIYSLAYSLADKCLYAATSDGLFIIKESNVKKIKYKSQDIFPSNLYYSGNKIYASDKKNGILIIEKGEITNSIQPTIREKKEVLTKIVIYKDAIIAKSSNGFFQFDLNGKLEKSIHSIFGFPSQRIIDFTFQNEKLWVSHSGGVQPIDLNYYQANGLNPPLKMNEILVNDEEQVITSSGKFDSDQRKIQFLFSSPTLKNKKAIRYFYFLDGYEKTWNINTFESNTITYNALAPGVYTFYLKAENQGKYSKLIRYSFIIAEPFYSRWWFIGFSVLLFLTVVFAIYRWQLKILEKKSKILNELHASKLTAIQSQMNPHFIFNSLNSIQDLVLKGDVENSYSYITTFSNLVRRTLNYSEKDFIDFEQEIKLLELYLSLEKLRFKKGIQYEIHYSKISDIMIPPLLIQPFIENAFVHGLLHKEGDKHLKITFELSTELICTIEDNGVGREKAKAIKQRQRSEYESFSGKAIHNRFDILNKVFEGNFGYTYEDLEEDGNPIGTRVILRIPVKHKY